MNVILLNGPSSAGKSSIAKELKTILDTQGATEVIALDDYLDMASSESIWEDDVFTVMPGMCSDIAAALNNRRNVIIDHVIIPAPGYMMLYMKPYRNTDVSGYLSPVTLKY